MVVIKEMHQGRSDIQVPALETLQVLNGSVNKHWRWTFIRATKIRIFFMAGADATRRCEYEIVRGVHLATWVILPAIFV
jgi:hypothetical protein